MRTLLRHIFDNTLLAMAAVVVALVGLGSLVVPQPVIAEKPSQVTLVSPLPLPVTGTVGVSGSLDVNVTNTPTVTIANSATSPLIVRTLPEAPTPYQRSLFFNQGPDTCTDFVCTITFDAVPAGHRLVVTYASARFALSGAMTSANVRIGPASTSEASILLPPPTSLGGTNVSTASPVTFYVEAGDQPEISVGGQFVSGVSNTAQVALVGHLVPVP